MKIHGLRLPKRKPRTKQDMIAYLEGHFRYSTMNSWNGVTSYAHNVKFHHLDLTRQQESACFEMYDQEYAMKKAASLTS